MINSAKLASQLIRGSLILLLFPASAFATPIYYYKYLGGTVAYSRAQIGNDNFGISYSGFTDTYVGTDNNTKAALLGLIAGLEFVNVDRGFSVDLGLGVYSSTAYYFYGNLNETPTGGETVALANYRYNITTTRLMGEAQINWPWGNFSPFISGGLGAAWNTAKGYSEAPNADSLYVPLPAFANNTNINFAYELGFGIGWSFNTGTLREICRRDYKGEKESEFKSERLTLGYRYVNSGSTSFGTRDSIYPYALSLGNLSDNEIYLTYTYIFN